MSIDSPPIPPVGEPEKKKNALLRGCLVAFLLALVAFCCLGSLVFLPLFTDYDPLGTDLKNRIEKYLPLNYLEDPSSFPGMEEFLDERESTTAQPDQEAGPSTADIRDAQSLPLATFAFNDFGTTFSYPAGWDIEMEGYTVTFYDPESYTYLYMGEEQVDVGTKAQEVATGVLDSIQEEAQSGSFQLLSSTSYPIPISDDGYLTLFEWVDQDGYYTWAYDLEIVSGESNIFFFLSGEDSAEIAMYGELLDIIASSLSRVTDFEPSSDA